MTLTFNEWWEQQPWARVLRAEDKDLARIVWMAAQNALVNGMVGTALEEVAKNRAMINQVLEERGIKTA